MSCLGTILVLAHSHVVYKDWLQSLPEATRKDYNFKFVTEVEHLLGYNKAGVVLLYGASASPELYTEVCRRILDQRLIELRADTKYWQKKPMKLNGEVISRK